jgi:uncharacterized protein (DUF952 family)
MLSRGRPVENARDRVAIIYKILTAREWQEAERLGSYGGSTVDHRDGFIHFSDRHQVVETAARHFYGATDLLLVAVHSDRLDGALRWEPSRGGALFPHLYGSLPLSAVAFVAPLPLDPDGCHIFPELQA